MSSDYVSRSRLFRYALLDAVVGLGDRGPAEGLASLVTRCRAVVGEQEAAIEALDAFAAIAKRSELDDAVSEAAALFESPQRFREALFFLRCTDRDAAAAFDLMGAQSYLSGAVMPASLRPEMAIEQASLLNTTTFEALWQGPEGLDTMVSAIERWREAYAPVYIAGHAEHVVEAAALITDVQAGQWRVEMLEKLNPLHRLGEPVGIGALLRFHDIASTFVCASGGGEVSAGLGASPVCVQCGYKLGDRHPVGEMKKVLADLDQALAIQSERLAQRALRRLTGVSGWSQEGRLRAFVEAIEVGDLQKLAPVLDEGMVEFLRDVLETPQPRINLIDRLAETHPEVTDESMEAVVAAFRALVSDELRRGGGRVLIGREETA